MDLTVENMFTEQLYEAREVVPGAFLSPTDRKRMLSHVVANLTHQILSSPAPNPAGLTITVQLVAGAPDTPPDLLVTATCPKYDLDAGFFIE